MCLLSRSTTGLVLIGCEADLRAVSSSRWSRAYSRRPSFSPERRSSEPMTLRERTLAFVSLYLILGPLDFGAEEAEGEVYFVSRPEVAAESCEFTAASKAEMVAASA